MDPFYAESGYVLDHAWAHSAFLRLMGQPDRGCIMLAYNEAGTMGYAVLTISFAMEYAGLCGCIDDLYVLPQYRRLGVGHAMLSHVREECRLRDCLAMHVEVGASNAAARALYEKCGLRGADDDRITLRGAIG
jgi:ribosomal protein S18 acetylase RimI-like enzyme